MKTRSIALLPLAAIGFVFFACTSRDGFDDKAPVLIDNDAQADSQPVATCEGLRCSRDLHEVRDGCTDKVVQTCGTDMGCDVGKCVPACDAAAAAQGSTGCSFWTVAPDVLRDSETGCYAAFVANTWDTPANVTAELGGAAIDISKSLYRAVPKGGGLIGYEAITNGIQPGDVGIVFLSQGDETPDTPHHVSCPAEVTPAFHGVVTKDHQTSISKAFHLSTNVPVSAYSIFPYGGAKSYIPAATLLTPSTSWDTTYMLVDAWRYEQRVGLGYPFVQIVAQEDTEVRVRPRVDIVDGINVTGGATGSLVKWDLKKGDSLEITQIQSLVGSTLEASHPVALFGGNGCAYVPEGYGACDSLHQQIPPVHQWSSSYSAVPYQSRRAPINGAPRVPESITWQVVAASDGTVLNYDPAPPVGAPLTLAGGQRAYFETDQLFALKSQDANHPIYLAQFMSGSEQYASLGDPDFVNIIPNDQFLDHYVFFVDYTYSDSTITIVRRKDVNGFHDVTLDCLGPVTGWAPLGSDGTTEYAWVSLTRGGTDVGKCTYGRREATSDGPFGLYVFGMDSYASYGFPAGAGSRPTSPFSISVR